MTLQIVKGFTEPERPAVAALYWDAFGRKLGRVMGRRGLAYVADVADPSHCLVALGEDGAMLGVAGFRTRAGSFVGGGYPELARHYGPVGAAWRAAVLSLLERDTDNARFLMDGIAVAASARGQGVGAALLAALAEEGRARGYRQIRLDVVDENARARALYEREGYRAVAHHGMGPLRLLFGFRGATTMVRDLGPAQA